MDSIKILRECLVFCVNHSRNKNNDSLKNYLLNEATDEQIMSLYWIPAKYINESFEVPEWALLPFHVLAGGAITNRVASALHKSGKIQNPDHAAEVMVGSLASYGATILAKQVYRLYKTRTDMCYRKCRAVVKNDKNNQAKMSVCFHQCKVQNLQAVIAKLRAERTACVNTMYPEKCMQNLDNQIVKMQTELQRSVQALSRAKFSLVSRLRKVPAHMSMKPSTEKWREND
jgi:hypothetical protein